MITKVKWKEHPILGNLEIDLAKEDGSPYKTIVFAGENGTGKTTIMEYLNDFLSLRRISFVDYIEYKIDNIPFKLTADDDPHYPETFFKRINLSNKVEDKVSRFHEFREVEILNDVLDIRKYGTAYSKAIPSFVEHESNKSSAMQSSDKLRFGDSVTDMEHLKSLLLDLDNDDTREFRLLNMSNNLSWLDFECKHSKLNQFTYAFNVFFDDLVFDKIERMPGEPTKILFLKGSTQINIDALSTGEKQVIFRGAFLLKDKENLRGASVFVDEPELSMHPKWQKKILKYYRDLFTQNDVQFSQIMLATHSEYVVESAMSDPDVLMCVLKNEQNGHSFERDARSVVNNNPVTSVELNYLAFGIPSNDYHNMLYGYIQKNSTQNDRVKECDEIILNHTLYDGSIHEKPSSYTPPNGNEINYSTLCTYIRNKIDHPDSSRSFDQEELECSIKLMIEICKQTPPRQPTPPQQNPPPPASV